MHSVHPLINEARRAFPAAREEYTRARRGKLGSHSTDQQGTGCGDMEAAGSKLLSVTRALLLVNADHGSAWNARKALVRDRVHESANVRQEIKAGFAGYGDVSSVRYHRLRSCCPVGCLSMFFPALLFAPFRLLTWYELQMFEVCFRADNGQQAGVIFMNVYSCLRVYLGPVLYQAMCLRRDHGWFRSLPVACIAGIACICVCGRQV